MADKKWKKWLAGTLAAVLLCCPLQAAAQTEAAAAETGESSGQTEAAEAETAVETAPEGEAAADVTVTAAQKKAAQEAAIVPEDVQEMNGHRLVAQNEGFQLFLYEPTLSIIIRDRKTGAVMESTVQESDGTLNQTWENFIASGISFDILNGVNEERSDLISAGAEVEVTETDNGFLAEVELSKYQISFAVEVSLNEDGITVEIPADSIEEKQENVTIGNLFVYPFLGYTYSSERDGYMLVPDGNGAIIQLEDNNGRFTSPLTLKVWGDNAGVDETYVLSLFWDQYQTVNDAEPVLAPVFGMIHTDTQMAVLGIIESGAEDAKIVAYPNGAVTNYNWITPEFTLRRIYKQLMSREGTSAVQLQEEKRAEMDIRLRYIFTGQEEADYAGLAVKYREYLQTEQKLAKKDDSFKVQLDFLGTDRENGMIWKKPVVMTTTDHIRNIYADLEKEGVTGIFSIYKGWQDGGIWSMPISKYKADPEIGGTRDLTKLLEETKEQGIELYLYQDALRANPDTVNTTFNVIKKLDESVYGENTYQEIYETYRFQTPAQSRKKLSESLASYEKAGVDRLALTGICNHLFSYNYGGKQYNRTETKKAYTEALTEASAAAGLVLEQPFSCFWNLTDSIVGMPVKTSNYIFTDEEVPFLSIALKGILPMYAEYTNFEANEQEYFLELVETGIFPSWYLTWEDPVDLLYTNSRDLYTSRYQVYKEEITEYYQKLKAVNEAVAGAVITDHEKGEDHVAVVTYSNGVKVYVNYNEEDVMCEGVVVEGMSYKVGKS